MTPRAVVAILRKDLVDSTRHGRILVIMLTPLLLAVTYNFTFRDERRPEVTAIYSPADAAPLIDRVRARVDAVIDLKVQQAADGDAVRSAVAQHNGAVGFILPAAAEEAVRSGSAPTVTVLSESGTTTRELLSSSLLAVFRDIAGQRTPATIRGEDVERGSDPLLLTRLGPRVYFVLGSLLMVVGMISIIVVPMILAEESEKRTLDALLMAGPIADVMVAKALVGLVYIALSVVIVLGLTRLSVRDMPMLVVALGGTSVALVGFGLLMGIVFRTAMQVSTWSGFLVLPVIMPAFLVGVPAPDAVQLTLRALPTGQAMRLLANAFSDGPVYGDVPLSIAIIAAWGIAGFALLAWRLSRREA